MRKPSNAEKTRFALHVALLMHRLGINKPDANVIAWVDGPAGLDKLLAGITEPEEQGAKK